MRNVPDIVGIGKRRIHKNAVECSQIAVAVQEIGLPCVVNTINRAEPVRRARLQFSSTAVIA
jgi:hypothetical protein